MLFLMKRAAFDATAETSDTDIMLLNCRRFAVEESSGEGQQTRFQNARRERRRSSGSLASSVLDKETEKKKYMTFFNSTLTHGWGTAVGRSVGLSLVAAAASAAAGGGSGGGGWWCWRCSPSGR